MRTILHPAALVAVAPEVSRSISARSILPILILTLAFLQGCGTRALTDDERVIRCHISHTFTKAEAYDRTEIWLAQSVVANANLQIEVRQPENGILVAHYEYWYSYYPVMADVPVADFAPITVTVTNKDRSSDLEFVIQSSNAPSNVVPAIWNDCRTRSIAFAHDIDGWITYHSELPAADRGDEPLPSKAASPGRR